MCSLADLLGGGTLREHLAISIISWSTGRFPGFGFWSPQSYRDCFFGPLFAPINGSRRQSDCDICDCCRLTAIFLYLLSALPNGLLILTPGRKHDVGSWFRFYGRVPYLSTGMKWADF
jgi:hypothetical protein